MSSDFEKTYQEYQQMIYAFLLRLCGNARLPEELTQETFYQALKHWGRFRGQSSIRMVDDHLEVCEECARTYADMHDALEQQASLENEKKELEAVAKQLRARRVRKAGMAALLGLVAAVLIFLAACSGEVFGYLPIFRIEFLCGDNVTVLWELGDEVPTQQEVNEEEEKIRDSMKVELQ